MATILLQIINFLFLCQVVNSVYSASNTKHTPCTYHSESVPCKLWNYTNVDCSERKLVCIPQLQHVANAVELLDLSSNKLEAIPDYSFIHFKRLLYLDLSTNYIHASRLSNNALSGLEVLRNLSLQANELRTLANRTLSGLKKLKYLDLSQNNLAKLIWFILSRPCFIRGSHLSANPITDLESDTFTVLRRLQKLEIPVTDVSNTTISPFAGLDSLSYLDL